MKKVLSVALAVLMICAISIPAFATTITDETANTGTAKVTVNTEEVAGGTFTVEYPATTAVKWGTPNTNIQYTSTTHLEAGSTLSVKVAKHADYAQMKYLDYKLDYTLGGDTDVTVDTVATKTSTLNFGIAEANWQAAPVAPYEAILTFTVAVV